MLLAGQARLSAEPAYGCCMFFAPVFFVMAIVNGAIQVLNIGPVVDAGCAHAASSALNFHVENAAPLWFAKTGSGRTERTGRMFDDRCFEDPPPCSNDPCATVRLRLKHVLPIQIDGLSNDWNRTVSQDRLGPGHLPGGRLSENRSFCLRYFLFGRTLVRLIQRALSARLALHAT